MTVMQAIRSLAMTGDVDSFYNSRIWRSKSHAIMHRDKYECQSCKKRGKYTKARCVHHIKSVRKYPELAFADHSLVSLCIRCHNAEHGLVYVRNKHAEGDKQGRYTVKKFKKKKTVPLTEERW